MRRRALLSACGVGLAGLAGCTGDTTTRTRTGTPTDSPTETPTETPTPSVSATFDSLQPALVPLNTDYLSIAAGEQQHLFVAIESDGSLDREAFSFHFDGSTYDPVQPYARATYRAYGDGAYDDETPNGWLLFSLPEQGDAATARLTWPGGEWTPEESVRQRLAAPDPPLSPTFSMPETAPNGEEFTLSVSVTNDGDIGGRFVAGITRYGPQIVSMPVEHVSVFVPPGETVTREYTQSPEARDEDVDDGESDAIYRFRWIGGEIEREIALQ